MPGFGSAAASVSAATLISLRVPAIVAVGLGVVGVVLGIVFGYPQMAILFAVGLGMGLANARLMQRSVVKVVSDRKNPTKGAIVGSSMQRLAFFTLIALAFGFFIRPDGIGVFIGLALFQMIFMAHTMTPMIKEYRRQ